MSAFLWVLVLASCVSAQHWQGRPWVQKGQHSSQHSAEKWNSHRGPLPSASGGPVARPTMEPKPPARSNSTLPSSPANGSIGNKGASAVGGGSSEEPTKLHQQFVSSQHGKPPANPPMRPKQSAAPKPSAKGITGGSAGGASSSGSSEESAEQSRLAGASMNAHTLQKQPGNLQAQQHIGSAKQNSGKPQTGPLHGPPRPSGSKGTLPQPAGTGNNSSSDSSESSESSQESKSSEESSMPVPHSGHHGSGNDIHGSQAGSSGLSQQTKKELLFALMKQLSQRKALNNKPKTNAAGTRPKTNYAGGKSTSREEPRKVLG